GCVRLGPGDREAVELEDLGHARAIEDEDVRPATGVGARRIAATAGVSEVVLLAAVVPPSDVVHPVSGYGDLVDRQLAVATLDVRDLLPLRAADRPLLDRQILGGAVAVAARADLRGLDELVAVG